MARSDRSILQKLAHTSLRLGAEARRNSLAEVFHENTKLGPLTSRAYSAFILNFIRSHRAQQLLELAHKLYTLKERTALPRVEPRDELERLIVQRRSVRRFSGQALGLEELARLLHFTYGKTDPRGRFRAVASGGALYPLEIYVVPLAIDGLEPGVYHYAVDAGALDLVRPCDGRAELKQVINTEGLDYEHAALAVLITASFRRTTVKYLDRGYRMVLMEAGEAAQTLCLLATSLGLGACLLGGFYDDELARFLDLDGVDEAPLLPILVGWPSQQGDPTELLPLSVGAVGGI